MRTRHPELHPRPRMANGSSQEKQCGNPAFIIQLHGGGSVNRHVAPKPWTQFQGYLPWLGWGMSCSGAASASPLQHPGHCSAQLSSSPRSPRGRTGGREGAG